MKRYRFKILIVCAILLGTSELANAACNQTLSPGANVASAIASAASGTTICLNSGSYGTVNLGSFTKSPRVIVEAVTPLGPTMGLSATNSANGVTFDGMSFTGGATISGSNTRNITIQNSDFGTDQLVVLTSGFNNNNILIDHNTFGAYNSTGFEGRITITKGGGPIGSVPVGVVVTNNTFGPGGCSDGIQASARGIVMGPGNVFTGIVQTGCSVHVDSIQSYGASHTIVDGNYFVNNTIHLGFYDGDTAVTVTNNVFGPPNGSAQNLQLGAIVGMNFSHNTLRNTIMAYGSKSGNPANTDWIVENNVLVNSDLIASGDQPGCGSNCIMRFNLKDTQSSTAPTGTNSISGSPTFVNGASPTTLVAYQLAPSSLGYRGGSDGKDMGSNYFSSGNGSDITPPTAPVNLRVQ